MIRKLFGFIAIAISLNFISFAYCDEKPVSFEMKLLCEESTAGCDKAIDPYSKKEIFLQKQDLFSLSDLGKASYQVQWETYRNYGSNEKSLMGSVSQSSSEPDAKISLTFTGEAAKRLLQVTTDNVNHRIGILLDGKLIIAPIIREPITTGDVEITGPTIKKSYAQDFVYRINKALGIETQEPSNEGGPRSGYLGVISIILGLLIGWGAIKLIAVVFPNFILVSSKSSIGSYLTYLFTNIEMQKRLIITIGILAFVQIVSIITIPGIDKSVLKEFIERMSYASGGLSPLQHIFMVQRMTIMTVGLAPFFTSCVLIQILSGVIPGLKKLYYNQENGRQELTKHTYILTIVFVLVQAYFIALWLESPSTWGGMPIVASPGMLFRLVTVVTITAAVTGLLFLADQINRYGVGNGIAVIAVSYLILKVLSAFEVVLHLIQIGKIEPMVILVIIALIVTLAYLAFCITKYSTTVEIQNNKGNKVQIPLRPTIVGKQPLTLAEAIFLFPLTAVSFIHSPSLYHFFRSMEYNTIIYLIVVGALTIFLVYVYAVIVFDLKDVEGTVKKYGYSFTNSPDGATGYLDNIMTRLLIWTGITLVLTIVLSRLCMIVFKVPHTTANLFSAGILLVIVGVFSDIISQIRFFKEKSESGIKDWVVCFIAYDEIEATIKSNFLKDKGISSLVEPLRFSWGLPSRTMVDQYRLYVPFAKGEEARKLLLNQL